MGDSVRSGTVSRRAILGSAFVAGALRSSGARGQGFSTQPLRLIVPFPAGGSADILSRTAGAAIGQQLGQSVVVENRAGAGGNIAADYVFRSRADGHTLLLAGQAIMAINQVLYQSIPYDPARFGYVGMLGANANVFVVNETVVPAKTIGDLIDAARKNPGKLGFGSNGIGSLSHLTGELLAHAAGVQFLHVPYRGAVQVSTDLIGGRLAFCVTGSTLATQLVQQKMLRALAVTTAERIPQLPDVPTLVESGFPTLNVPSWWALVVAPETPADILDRLQKACAAATATPAFKAALSMQSTSSYDVRPENAAAFLAGERTLWASAVKQSGATAE